MQSSQLSIIQRLTEKSEQVLAKIPYLKILVLFGSRARGDNQENSDWDFAILYDEELREPILKQNAWRWLEAFHILGEIFGLNDDNIDIVELNSCSRLIAHYVARDGKVIYEQTPGEFENFQRHHLMSDAEIKEMCRQIQQEIELDLQRRGV
ncbi:MAG: nucleotidyltransferase domain-containing protein [Roseofilum sp. SID2]|uniref:type VII toxin-antitoxin system MntA family adenylyltransferase antitoxin n=1 Tax=Roseofilum sp. SID2 TaxID=2821498 RepID=UPI001B009A17|nr:nucleotidyltransferase domain-containing protein [Roseofilum sp. SID2]MBP0013784.1 nucleotidyltransferase domain-containing protein [Roseofilum sp. SID3]MBP0026236.1 nucleotidyltransferase domain-containing protein [Roseofilum sp. SID2]